jgi:hypothetical protein
LIGAAPLLARIAAGAVLALAACGAIAPPRAMAEGASPAAWELAILAERLGKLHAQAGHGLLAERARRALAEGTRRFDTALAEALAQSPGHDAREGYLLLRLLWQEYRALLARPATRESARRMGERTEELAWVAMKATRAMPASPGSVHPRDEALRAGVLAQRVARMHLLRGWDVRDEAASRELAAASAQLRRSLERLHGAQGLGEEIAAELRVAHNQHLFLERAAQQLATQPASAQALEVVAKTGDNILESMQRVSRLGAVAGLSASPPR